MTGVPPKDSAPEILALLDEIRGLMALRGDNPFKVRAFEKATQALDGRTDLPERARAGTLTELPGIGKGISEVITEFVLHGTSRVRDELRAALPAGLLELTRVPGLGPKKALALIDALGVRDLVELEYACRENRLLGIPGFGAKAQQKILEGVAFLNAHAGQRRLSDALGEAEKFERELRSWLPEGSRWSRAGALRRELETLAALEYVVALEGPGPVGREGEALREKMEGYGRAAGVPIAAHVVEARRFGYQLAAATGSEAHWAALGAPAPFDAASEVEFYDRLGLPWIAPELRERGEEVALARAGGLEALMQASLLKGSFHCHTTRSDGTATLEEMVRAARALGHQYLGISDHSQSAFYAQGLKLDALEAQRREIREVQEKIPEVRIFWGIESDILADGSLDYDEAVLRRFDFVIASIHSRFNADRAQMTERILKAIRHPCTRFLGHATGRLLLGRPGYDVDMEAIIKTAAQHGVAIEINANPARLDIDWRWGPALRAAGTMVSVNPDAHATGGLEDIRYGLTVARKALLPATQVLNARSAKEIEQWLRNRSSSS